MSLRRRIQQTSCINWNNERLQDTRQEAIINITTIQEHNNVLFMTVNLHIDDEHLYNPILIMS